MCFKVSDYLLGFNHPIYYNYSDIRWLITHYLFNGFEKFWTRNKKF